MKQNEVIESIVKILHHKHFCALEEKCEMSLKARESLLVLRGRLTAHR